RRRTRHAPRSARARRLQESGQAPAAAARPPPRRSRRRLSQCRAPAFNAPFDRAANSVCFLRALALLSPRTRSAPSPVYGGGEYNKIRAYVPPPQPSPASGGGDAPSVLRGLQRVARAYPRFRSFSIRATVFPRLRPA